MKKSAIVLQKPSGTVAVRIDINMRQRKLYNGLLYVAKQQIRADLKKEKDLLIELLSVEKDRNKSAVITTLKNIMVNVSEKIEQEKNNEQFVYFLTKLKCKIINMINLLQDEKKDDDGKVVYHEKLQDTLLHIAEFNLLNKKRVTFRVPLAELKKSLMEEGHKDKNDVVYITQLEEMMTKTAEYNILTKDKIIQDKFVLIPRIKKVLDGKSNLICMEYEIPTMVNESLIRSDGIYASIDLVIVRGLKSKYAIILYELCKDYQKTTIPKMELDTFRKIFCVENKYPYMNDLKKRVLEPATTEINKNPNINFMVDYEPIKSGRKHTHIKFKVAEKRRSIKRTENIMKQKQEDMAGDEPLEMLLAMLPEGEREKGGIVIRKVLNKEIKVKEPLTFGLVDYIARQIDYTNNYKNAGSYQAIFISALKGGYVLESKKMTPGKDIKTKILKKNQENKTEFGKKQYLKFLKQDEKTIEKYIQKARQANPEIELGKLALGVDLALKNVAAHIWAEDYKKRE